MHSVFNVNQWGEQQRHQQHAFLLETIARGGTFHVCKDITNCFKTAYILS